MMFILKQDTVNPLFAGPGYTSTVPRQLCEDCWEQKYYEVGHASPAQLHSNCSPSVSPLFVLFCQVINLRLGCVGQ